MSKKVTLSKTFSNEAEYQHFKTLYDANTSAFENVWHLEVEGEESAPAEKTVKQTVLETFEAKVISLAEELEITVEAAWEKVHGEMTSAEDDEEQTKKDIASDPVEKTDGEGNNANGPAPGASTEGPKDGAGEDTTSGGTEDDAKKEDASGDEQKTEGGESEKSEAA